jgi:hypothetical protein
MTGAERKAVGYIVRLASDLYAATMGNAPIYDNRTQMREAIGQSVDADIASLNQAEVLADWVVAANQKELETLCDATRRVDGRWVHDCACSRFDGGQAA